LMEKDSRANHLTLGQLLARAAEFEDSDPQQAKRCASEALDIATHNRSVAAIAHARRRLGHITFKLGLFEEALEHYKEGLVLARRMRNRRLRASCVNGLGIAHERLGDYETALICFEHFIEITGAEKDLFAFVIASINIGRLLGQVDRLDDAREIYRDALDKVGAEKVDGITMLKHNLGACLFRQKRHEEAKLYFLQALAEFPKDQPLDLILCRANLAETLAVLKEFEEAEVTAKLGLQCAKQIGSKQLELKLLVTLSDIARMAGHLGQAIDYGNEALTICETVVDSELNRATHEALASAFEAVGNHRAALTHYKQFAALRLQTLDLFWQRNGQQALQGSRQHIARLLGVVKRTSGYVSRFVSQRTVADAALTNSLSPTTNRLLSAREGEVLALLSKGESNNTIAENLGISAYTVRYHVSSIFNKLGVGKRSEAVAAGIERGLIT
jgi:tetratricopeptide (TPR) repeat protein